MKRRSSFSRGEVFCRTAVLAAHALFQPQGARLRDIHFYVLLFSNWLEHAMGEEPFTVRSMQVSRFLRSLCDEGHMREARRGKVPRYILTRSGVVEMLRAIVDEPLYRRPTLLLFVRYFLGNYRNIITEMVSDENARFSPALRLEVEHLLDVPGLIRRQRELATREREKLRLRVRDSFAMGELAAARFKEGRSQEEIVTELEKRYPYELNSQKPLTELYAAIPKGHAYWELTSGALSRASDLWEPMNVLWEAYITAMERMEKKG